MAQCRGMLYIRKPMDSGFRRNDGGNLTTLPSITAAVRQEMAVGVFCSGIAKPWPDDAVSTETIPKPARHSRGIAVAAGTAVGRISAPSMGSTLPETPPPFCVARSGAEPGHCQNGLDQHRQGDVPVLAAPAAHLILVQSHLTLGLLEGIFDHLPGARYPHQLLQRDLPGTETPIVGQVFRIGDATPHQQPTPLVRRRPRP